MTGGTTRGHPSNAALALCGLAVVMAIGAALLPPLQQPPEYHQFADRRACGWLPNCLDAGSNLLFVLVGTIGLAFLWQQRHRPLFEHRAEAPKATGSSSKTSPGDPAGRHQHQG